MPSGGKIRKRNHDLKKEGTVTEKDRLGGGRKRGGYEQKKDRGAP